MKLSDKIVRLRKSNGMSQEELADKLGVSRQAISRWEMGTAMPDATNILQLSRLFQVTTDYLLNDEYQSDNDLPKVKEVKTDGIHQIMIFLITLEVMVLIIQFMSVVILQNIFFGVLSFIPFIAMVGGFEYAYQKKANEQNERTLQFRKRFYKVSAWLGTYFPIRLLVSALVHFYPRPINSLVLECVIAVLYLMTAIEEVGFFQSVPLWMVTFLGSLFITVLSFILIMTVYGRFFRLYMFTALAPLPLASFAGEDTSFMGKAFLRSYLGVCMEGAIVVLACLIFSAFAASGAPIADTSLPVVTMSWQYVAQTIFNMLILVALIKGAERIAKEMFGL